MIDKQRLTVWTDINKHITVEIHQESPTLRAIWLPNGRQLGVIHHTDRFWRPEGTDELHLTLNSAISSLLSHQE